MNIELKEIHWRKIGEEQVMHLELGSNPVRTPYHGVTVEDAKRPIILKLWRKLLYSSITRKFL